MNSGLLNNFIWQSPIIPKKKPRLKYLLNSFLKKFALLYYSHIQNIHWQISIGSPHKLFGDIKPKNSCLEGIAHWIN